MIIKNDGASNRPLVLASAHYWMDNERESSIWIDIPLDDDLTVTPDIAWIFANGQCHALAVALHELMGYPIVGCYTTGNGDLRTGHFALELPSHELADINGVYCGDFIGRRPVKPERITGGQMRNFFPPAMEFARHYAPTISQALKEQIGVPYPQRSKWPFKQPKLSPMEQTERQQEDSAA